MDIVEFFQLSSGKWSSQKTNHHLAVNQTEGGKADLQIDLLPKTAPDVIALCEQHKMNPELALCGVRASWNGSMEGDAKKQTGETLLVAIADSANPNEGKLLRPQSSTEPIPTVGRYVMGEDESLTFIAEDETMYAEERLWFASPNLRFRTSIVKQLDQFSTSSFYSEIRMGVVKPPADAAAVTQASAE